MQIIASSAVQWQVPKLRERLIAAANVKKLSPRQMVYHGGLSKTADWFGIIQGTKTELTWDQLRALCDLLEIPLNEVSQ